MGNPIVSSVDNESGVILEQTVFLDNQAPSVLYVFEEYTNVTTVEEGGRLEGPIRSGQRFRIWIEMDEHIREDESVTVDGGDLAEAATVRLKAVGESDCSNMNVDHADEVIFYPSDREGAQVRFEGEFNGLQDGHYRLCLLGMTDLAGNTTPAIDLGGVTLDSVAPFILEDSVELEGAVISGLGDDLIWNGQTPFQLSFRLSEALGDQGNLVATIVDANNIAQPVNCTIVQEQVTCNFSSLASSSGA